MEFVIEVLDIYEGDWPAFHAVVYVFDEIDEDWIKAELRQLSVKSKPYFVAGLMKLDPRRYHRWATFPVLEDI